MKREELIRRTRLVLSLSTNRGVAQDLGNGLLPKQLRSESCAVNPASMTISPFYQTTLNEELERRIQRRKAYSLRAFAKSLGVAASTLSRILSGKKVPGFRFAQQAFAQLELTPAEQNLFLASLVQTKKKLGAKQIRRDLKNHSGTSGVTENQKPRELTLDSFRVIADWYHYAILELTFVEDFSSDHRWIARRLSISRHEVDLAIDRLMALELLEKRDGRYFKTCQSHATADLALTTPAHKRRQKQILERAFDSLDNDPIELRNHSAMTMAIDLEMIPIAKARIEKFKLELCELLEAGKRDRVYELSVNLFPLDVESNS